MRVWHQRGGSWRRRLQRQSELLDPALRECLGELSLNPFSHHALHRLPYRDAFESDKKAVLCGDSLYPSTPSPSCSCSILCLSSHSTPISSPRCPKIPQQKASLSFFKERCQRFTVLLLSACWGYPNEALCLPYSACHSTCCTIQLQHWPLMLLNWPMSSQRWLITQLHSNATPAYWKWLHRMYFWRKSMTVTVSVWSLKRQKNKRVTSNWKIALFSGEIVEGPRLVQVSLFRNNRLVEDGLAKECVLFSH